MEKLFPEQEPVDLSGADHISVPPEAKPAAFRKFIFFSLIGVLMFLTPIHWGDKWTIGIGILADALKAVIQGYLPLVAVLIVVVSAALTLWATLLKPKWSQSGSAFANIFNVHWIWLLLRVLGAVFIVMIYTQTGPEWVISKFTGGVILNDLNPVLIPFFFFAVMMLPFLVDYGLMEYIGTLLSKPFQKIFKLPGRSAIDASASWLGSGTVGVLITAQQYEKGFYSQREAAIISTSFSLASIAFSLLIANFIGIPHLFIPFYFTVVVAGLIAAVIMARIPPLSWKKDTYHVATGKQIAETIPAGTSMHTWAVEQGVRRAHTMPGFGKVTKNSLQVLADVYLGLMPVVFAIGTIALALSEYTPVFTILSYPMVPLLELLQIPEAAKAAPATVVGFADMFLPAVLGKGIENEMTKFVIACLSLTQVIYMTEVGALILKSKINVNLAELFLIFVMRTLITLPIIAFMAHFVVF